MVLGYLQSGDLLVEPHIVRFSRRAKPYTSYRRAGSEFIYMLSGGALYRYVDRTYQLSAGDPLLFDAEGLHGPEAFGKTPVSYFSLAIRGTFEHLKSRRQQG